MSIVNSADSRNAYKDRTAVLFTHGSPVQTVKIASQSSLRQQRKESESFSAGACTWQKIHLRLQVWNLFAYGEQIMRAADCKKWRKSPKGFFDKLDRTAVRSHTAVLLVISSLF